MDNKRQATSDLGCLGSSFLLFLLIRLALRGGYWWNVQRERKAAAATEAVCHFVGNAEEYIGEHMCLRGPVADVRTTPEFRITFGFANQYASFLAM